MLGDIPGYDRKFHTTRWSLIQAAGDSCNPARRQALDALCRAYWGPVYAYLRRRGNGVDDAQDLTQSFFAALLEKNPLKVADPDRGRFRSFLLACVKHYAANEWDRARAKKRGGEQVVLPLDFASAESDYVREPVDDTTPEQVFERDWALAVLARTLESLEREQERSGQGAVFGRLKAWLTSLPEGVTYREVASDLGMSEGSVKVSVHRLRKRFGALLRDEIEQTVGDIGEVDAEIRHLFAALEQ